MKCKKIIEEQNNSISECEKTIKEIKKTDGDGLNTLRKRSKRIANKKGKGSEYNRAKEKNKKIENF